MEAEILEALRRDFADVEGNVAFEPTTNRYNGFILSEQFAGLTFVERQHRVFALLRSALGARAQEISMLFTYTHGEYEQLQAA